MVKRMLIDAAHPEETRVAIVSGNKLEEFDYESARKTQLKGNIYLAKVTRVEPSLQAAFVDYGGNRHGFLAFSEIHPDYYRIPVADRKEVEDEPEEDDSDDESARAAKAAAEAHKAEGDGEEEPIRPITGEGVETLGGDEMEEIEEIRPTRARPERRYKIQEVVKRRQIVLVQVTKEERGTKGAALTTYLSLAGRYCVLMPNTPRGGGISRKVTNPSERKKMKSIMEQLNIPDGLAIILRTAGVARSKAEVKRDYEYLVRLWNEIRELTLVSKAPALIYEEGNLIKRAIRDLYTNQIAEVLVEGEEGYRTAKDFMRMLIPSHAKRVKKYKEEDVPVFHRYQVEAQIDNIHSPTIQLKSGGYIVMDSTEALVAIDVNSGRSTRERHIEETAYKTNLEAAEEVARQLRLRDLAGLIVIDFIDMDDSRNNTQVEKRLKEAMRVDRARIQVGRISAFGLLELSRQRLRPSLIEASTERCHYCGGSGLVRSTESTALHVLRQIEDEGIRGRSAAIEVFVPTGVAFYLLNQKRKALGEIEQRYGISVRIAHDDELIPPDMRVERLEPRAEGKAAHVAFKAEDMGELAEAGEEEEGRERGRSRRRPRKRKPRVAAEEAATTEAPALEAEGEEAETPGAEKAEGAGEQRRPRRRGKRGGRRRSRRGTKQDVAAAGAESDAGGEPGEEAPAAASPGNGADQDAGEPAAAEAATSGNGTKTSREGDGEKPRAKPRRRSRGGRKKSVDSESAGASATSADDEVVGSESGAALSATGSGLPSGDADGDDKMPRKGWWRPW